MLVVYKIFLAFCANSFLQQKNPWIANLSGQQDKFQRSGLCNKYDTVNSKFHNSQMQHQKQLKI